MVQFKLRRAALVLRWSLVQNWRRYVRTTLVWLLILLLSFCLTLKEDATDGVPRMFIHVFMVYVSFVVLLAMGPAIFPDQKGKRSELDMLMLPASNAEKYAVRCLMWLLFVPCLVVAVVGADLLQYAAQVLVFRYEHPMLVAEAFSPSMLGSDLPPLNTYFLLTLLWLNSYFALAASLIRAHKAVLIVAAVLLIGGTLLFEFVFKQGLVLIWWNYQWLLEWLLPLVAVVNYVLAYHFFCRTQVIGKLINY